MSNIHSHTYDWLPEDDTHPVVCILCEGKNTPTVAHTFLLNGTEFSVLHCEVDDLLFLSPQPGERYAEALYNHPSYFTIENDQYGHLVTEQKGKDTAEKRINELYENGIYPKTFLEIGSGKGYTLEAAAEKGMEAVGIEFSDESVKEMRERNLDVHRATLEVPVPDVVTARGPFDVTALYSVLEHVPNPRLFLESITSLIASEGIVVIRVPKMSPDGPWLSLLDHFWHFTPTSLNTLLERVGITIIASFPSGTFRGSEGQRLESMTVFGKLADSTRE